MFQLKPINPDASKSQSRRLRLTFCSSIEHSNLQIEASHGCSVGFLRNVILILISSTLFVVLYKIMPQRDANCNELKVLAIVRCTVIIQSQATRV